MKFVLKVLSTKNKDVVVRVYNLLDKNVGLTIFVCCYTCTWTRFFWEKNLVLRKNSLQGENSSLGLIEYIK